ncbi:hypothetical protein Fmac_030116 [Flemingia macrophylla]|uniref:PPM-type phosphatase domain-containing protein n=1 Tax=Flemingia macrophylla TaxID=520843 RepID=A0ABD1LC99_9FABA
MSENTETQKREAADSECKDELFASKKPKIESCEKGSNDDSAKEPSFFIEADAAEDKGSRHTMEDAWVVLLDATLDYPGKLRCAHFAIYDGHGGRLAAEYAQKHLHQNVLSAGLPRELLDVKTAKRSILNGFQKTDESLLQESAEGGWQDGATAVCVWVLGQKVFVANIGDAKAVLARSTDGSLNHSDGVQALKAIVLTREHKPIFPLERARIQKSGGFVSQDGRLQGGWKFLGHLEIASSKRWVLLHPQIFILLTFLIESISSFLAVMACGACLVPVMLLILFRSY